MASSHFLCLALLVILSFLTLEMASGARSLAPATNPGDYDQATFLKKHFPFPKFKIPYKKPIPIPKFKIPHKKPIVIPKFNIPHKKPIAIPKYKGDPSNPQPYLSSPSLPFPDLPLVPAIPLTPQSVPVSKTASTISNKKTNAQSP